MGVLWKDFQLGKIYSSLLKDGLKKAETVKANSAALIDEYYFRRKGLGIATLFITLLCIGLYLKIRKIEKR